MERKTILLIADDGKTIAAVKESVRNDYQLEVAKDAESAQYAISRQKPDLIIIDYELKAGDGLQLFKKLGTLIKVVMLSASGSIPLAVSATKLGVAEFLRRPIDAAQLKKVIAGNLAGADKKLSWDKAAAWLVGADQALLGRIESALQQDQDLVLSAEPGIPKRELAEFLHASSPRRDRKLAVIDAAAFRREDQESRFWALLQELLALPEQSSLQEPLDRVGTVYLANVGSLDQIFQRSIWQYFAQRSGKIDRTIRVIIDAAVARAPAPNFFILTIPPLRERLSEIARLIKHYLDRAAARHGRNIRYLDTQLLELLGSYDWPGNYRELERWLEEAVLAADGDRLEIKHLPVDGQTLLALVGRQAVRANLTLNAARQRFEKELYPYLLAKSEGDLAKTARFLDVPKTVLTERLQDLAD